MPGGQPAVCWPQKNVTLSTWIPMFQFTSVAKRNVKFHVVFQFKTKLWHETPASSITECEIEYS
jgi:hypothetical protein